MKTKKNYFCWKDKIYLRKLDKLNNKKLKAEKKLNEIKEKINKLKKSSLNWRNPNHYIDESIRY